MNVLFDNADLTLEEHPELRVVVVRRKGTRVTPEETDRVYAPALTRVNAYRGWGLVIDLRQAVGRNDTASESRLESIRASVEGVFSRIAVLLGTAAGELQVRRLQSQRQTVEPATGMTLLTRDEAAAMRHAAGE